jgi:hypothetical protein
VATVQQVDLGYRPRPWQAEVHRRLKRFSVLVVHRRAGKTVLAVMALIDAALRCGRERPRFAYLAPFLGQAKAIAWDYLRAAAAKVPGATINASELWVEFPSGARIRVFGADNPDALRGLYLDGVVLDEVAQMAPEVWIEILRPALADRHGWALFIGTPKGINLFSEVYFAAIGDPAWFAGCYTYLDTKTLDEGEVAAMRQQMSEGAFRQEMLCDFSAGSDDQLLSVEIVQAAAKRHVREEDYAHAAKVLGVDVARYGGDRSSIVRRQGLASWKPRTWLGIGNMELADAVAREWDEWQADACFIDMGRGEGVYDRLVQMRYHPIGIDFGGKPSTERFRNKRSEMWWECAEWLRNGGAIADDQELKADLCAPRYSYDNARGCFQLESKEDMVKRGLRSPDVGDSLALTFAGPVRPRSGPGSIVRPRATAMKPYDPTRRIGR